MLPGIHVLRIERQPRRKHLAVHLSDGGILSLTPDVVARFGLGAGAVLSAERLHEIARVQAREHAMAAALRLVAFRPRSETEMRRSLSSRSVSPDVQDEVVSRLRDLGLVDDAAFAAHFVESRDRNSPRSQRLISQELRQKGIPRELASGSAAIVDDADAAYRAAARRASGLRALEFADFERRVGSFLLRRGFSYDTTRATVYRLWQERAEAGPGEPPSLA